MEILNSVHRSDGAIEFNRDVSESIVRLRKSPTLISEKAIDLIKHFESAHDGDKNKINLQPEMDPVGIWTVGYGHVLIHNGKMLMGEKDRALAQKHQYANLTEEEADDLLKMDINLKYIPEVWKMVKRNGLSPDQLGALVAFCYNCGTHYKNSKGALVPYALWANVNNNLTGKAMWDYWRTSVTKSKGRVLGGLARRRKAEALLYLRGKLDFYPRDNWA